MTVAALVIEHGGDEDQRRTYFPADGSRPTESRQTRPRSCSRAVRLYDVEAPADVGGTTSTGQCAICTRRCVTLPSSSPEMGP